VARRDHEQVADFIDANREAWEALVDATPSDAADIIEQLDEADAAQLLSDLPTSQAAEILEEIAPELAVELLEQYPLAELAAALSEMPSEAAADLIGELDDEVTEDVLAAMSDEAEDEVRDLLSYPPDTAGGLMTTEIAALPLGLTTGEAIERIRQLREEYEDLSYVYVVDDQNHLKGVISFRDLVFRRPGAPLADVMVSDPISVGTLTDREEVAEITQRYHLFGIPVVDDHEHLVGMVTTDAVIEAIQDEATEDFAVAVGAGIAETVYTNVTSSFRMRMPWLGMNLLLALVVALVIEVQTGIIRDEPVLAALMPIVALLGGNGGNQSLAVMIRSLASDDVPTTQVRGILARQTGVGLLNGLAIGILSGVVCWLLITRGVFESKSDALQVAMVVGASAFAVLIVGTLAGSGIPVIFRKFGLDPALASSIFLTLITDTVGFGGFLLLASALI
jgi:magnesium transporter